MKALAQKLQDLRSTIDQIDDKLIDLISQRVEISEQIQQLKQKTGQKRTDKKRENEILRKIEKKSKNSRAATIITLIYKECFKYAKQQITKTTSED